MITESESKMGYVYGLFLITFLILVIVFLLCDFKVLPQDTCGEINGGVTKLSDWVNGLLGI